MGERGQITRLLAAKYGGHLTFAALSAERASAPGQPTIEQLKGLYRFKQQGPGSKLFGIVGNPVHHSKSPLIHNSAFEHIGGSGGRRPVIAFGFFGGAGGAFPVPYITCLPHQNRPQLPTQPTHPHPPKPP
jgi:hypothetical protein